MYKVFGYQGISYQQDCSFCSSGQRNGINSHNTYVYDFGGKIKELKRKCEKEFVNIFYDLLKTIVQEQNF